MPTYTPFPAEQALPPPGRLADTRYFYFFLEAEQTKTQGLLDRYFNDRLKADGKKIEYQASSLVLLTFSHVNALTSADRASGSIAYKDIAFWMPVWKRPALLHIKPDCLFPPYIFVDNVATMATGREVFGLPKQLGRFRMPETLDHLADTPEPQFVAEVVGRIQDGGFNDWHKLISIRRVGGPKVGMSPDPIAPLRFLQALVGHKRENRGIHLPEWLTSIRALGLKQFRDAAQPDRACYQSIIEAPLVMQPGHEVRVLTDRYEVMFEDLDSHPVMKTFGFKTGWQAVGAAVYLRAEMTMRVGEEVWRAP